MLKMVVPSGSTRTLWRVSLGVVLRCGCALALKAQRTAARKMERAMDFLIRNAFRFGYLLKDSIFPQNPKTIPVVNPVWRYSGMSLSLHRNHERQ
jgi:hypothetical protein